MKFIALFEDAPGKSDLRGQHMSRHLKFLEENAETILAAGPLFDGSTGAGGLWLLEAETPEAVQALVETDPFWSTGLRQSVTIRQWRQVFRDGTRQI